MALLDASKETLAKMDATLTHLTADLGVESQDGRRRSREMYRGTVARLITAGCIALAAIIAVIYFKSPAHADTYASIYRYIAVLISGALSYIPFIVAEVILYAALIAGIVVLGFAIYRILKKSAKLAGAARLGANAALIAAVMWFLFVMMYGFAYHCTPLARQLDLDTRPSEVTELYNTTVWLMDNARDLSTKVPRDESGSMVFGEFNDIAKLIPQGYDTLGMDYDVYQSTYAPVKRVRSWKAMSEYGITGIYMPYTAEACVNPDNTIPALPFTMAHEMAHRLMIAPEDEANFSAFLACTVNSDRRVRYSGYFMAYRYCINALYAADQSLAYTVMDMATPELNHDLTELNELIIKYESPVQELGNKINDTYLKANAQDSGVKSYGQVVDLLIAWNAKMNAEDGE